MYLLLQEEHVGVLYYKSLCTYIPGIYIYKYNIYA